MGCLVSDPLEALMGHWRQFNPNLIAWFDLTARQHHAHNPSFANQIPSLVMLEHGVHQSCLQAVELRAGVAQTRNLEHRSFAKVHCCASGKSEQINPACGDVFAHLSRVNLEPSSLKFVVKLGVNEMHLAQIGLRRVSRNPGPMFDRHAHVRVALDAQSLEQLDAGLLELLHGVGWTAKNSFDGGVHERILVQFCVLLVMTRE